VKSTSLPIPDPTRLEQISDDEKKFDFS